MPALTKGVFLYASPCPFVSELSLGLQTSGSEITYITSVSFYAFEIRVHFAQAVSELTWPYRVFNFPVWTSQVAEITDYIQNWAQFNSSSKFMVLQSA